MLPPGPRRRRLAAEEMGKHDHRRWPGACGWAGGLVRVEPEGVARAAAAQTAWGRGRVWEVRMSDVCRLRYSEKGRIMWVAFPM